MAEKGITEHAPLNDEERARYEELKDHFSGMGTISERWADPYYKEYLELELRATSERADDGFMMNPRLFANNGTGHPLFFKGIDKKRVKVLGYDHGIMARYLMADPQTRACKIDGTIATWDGAHYRRTDKPVIDRIIELTDEIGYTMDDTDEYGNTVRKHFRMSTTDGQRVETMKYLERIAEDHEGAPATLLDFPNGRLDLDEFGEAYWRREVTMGRIGLEEFPEGYFKCGAAKAIDDPEWDAITDKDWENGAMWAGFDNEPDPYIYTTNFIPHPWNPAAVCLELDMMLDNISCNRADVRATLEEIPGSILWRDPYKLQQCNFAVLIGEGGSGKTTYFKTVEYTIGEDNIADVKIHDLGERFIPRLEDLPNALAILDEEVSSDYIKGLAVDRIKSMSTGGRPTLDRKGISGVTYRSMATIVVATNTMFDMSSKDVNSALEDRLVFVPMDRRFRGTDAQDVDILDKVCTEAGAERFLFLAVCGLLRLLKNKRYSIGDEDEKRKAELRAQNNTLEGWLLDTQYDAERFLSWDPDHTYDLSKPGADIYDWDPRESPFREYERWCTANGHKTRYSQIKFSNFMCRRFGLERGDTQHATGTVSGSYRPYLPAGTMDAIKEADIKGAEKTQRMIDARTAALAAKRDTKGGE